MRKWNRGEGIFLNYAPELKGIVIDPGDEVSEVKLLDGTRMFVTNKHLRLEDETS